MTLAFSLYAQNEASKNFVKNAVLARQEGSSFDKFPKMEIGFVGRNDNAQPMAFLFIRLQSALETGGGIFTSFYGLNRNTNQLEKSEGDAFRQFVSLLSQFTITVDVSKMRKATSIDIELGEFELTDFQWYMTENQWKSNRNKTVRIKAKVMTANNENRLYFYRTSDVRDYRNEFETFTMPNEVYLTEKQCRQIVDAYEKENSFVWKAVEAAIDSAKRAMR
jgi:hypothetical protein